MSKAWLNYNYPDQSAIFQRHQESPDFGLNAGTHFSLNATTESYKNTSNKEIFNFSECHSGENGNKLLYRSTFCLLKSKFLLNIQLCVYSLAGNKKVKGFAFLHLV